MENLVDKTLNELKTTTNPGKILCHLWTELFNTRFTPELVQQFHRLVRIYGRYRAFFAVVKLSDRFYGREYEVTVENPYSLIAYFANEIVKRDYAGELNKGEESLSEYIKEYNKVRTSNRQVSLPENFEENDGTE